MATELVEEFIHNSWCHFFNNLTTHEFSLLPNDSDESITSPTPPITTPITFIQNSHKILLEDLALLATALRITGIIDEQNNFTWEEVSQTPDIQTVTEEDSKEDNCSTMSSTTSSSDSEETIDDNNTIDEEMVEYFNTPLRIALFSSFPPANRFSEQSLTHYVEKLTALFMKLIKDNHI